MCVRNLDLVQWHDGRKICPFFLTFAVEHPQRRWQLLIFVLSLYGVWSALAVAPRRAELYFVAGADSSQEQAHNVTFWFVSGLNKQIWLSLISSQRSQASCPPQSPERFGEITPSDCFLPIRYPPRVEKWCHKPSSLFYNSLVFAPSFKVQIPAVESRP